MIPRIKHNIYLKLKSDILEQDMFEILCKKIEYRLSCILCTHVECEFNFYCDEFEESVTVKKSIISGYYEISIQNAYGTEDGSRQNITAKELYHNFGIKFNQHE